MDTGVLSVDIQGASLHRISERIQIRDRHGKLIKEIPAFRLHSVWLFGSVEVTNYLLRFCLKYGPAIHFMTLSGRWRGSIGPEPSHRVLLRIRQFKLFCKKNKRFELAKCILKAKIMSQFDIIRVWNRRKKGVLSDCQENFRVIIENLNDANSVDELLGIEGTASKVYFDGYRRLFTHEHGFLNRNRRPPQDAVNALLSFGYTLLFSEALSAVGITGLDPYLGFLHSPKSRRASLALDLMEPFRKFVDELVLTRMNLMTFQARDFYKAENGGIYLKQESIPKFVTLFGERMAQPWKIGSLDYSVRRLLRKAAKNLKEIILGNLSANEWFADNMPDESATEKQDR